MYDLGNEKGTHQGNDKCICYVLIEQVWNGSYNDIKK